MPERNHVSRVYSFAAILYLIIVVVVVVVCKLSTFGLSPNHVNWFQSYLTPKQASVWVPVGFSLNSFSYPMKSGVPKMYRRTLTG